MIYLFSPYKYAANDLSMYYLFQIFGPMNNVLASTSSSITTFQKVLPEMFKAFNTVVLAVGALVVVYVTIVGMMNTAHEGQFMGKNWNNLWIPIRTVLGISMLVPSASGYSYLQIIMMWVIVQGIGAANLMWYTVIKTLSGSFTEFGTVVPPLMEANRAIEDLFQGLTCAQTAYLRDKNPYTNTDGSATSGNDNAYYCNVNSGNSFCSNPVSFYQNQYKMGPSSACGILEFCDSAKACSGSTPLQCKACTAQILAYTTIIPNLYQAAYELAQIDRAYQLYYYASADPSAGPVPARPDFISQYCTKKGISGGDCVGGKKLPSPLGDASSPPAAVVEDIYWPAFQAIKGDSSPDPIQEAKKTYADTMQGLADAFKTEADAALAPDLKAALAKGWIMAGSYYQVIARLNARAQSDSAPATSVSTDIEVVPNNTSSPLYHYRTNFDTAARIIAKSGGSSMGGAAGRAAGPVARAAQGTTKDIDGSVAKMWAPEGVNPVAQLTMTGYTILFAIQMFYLGMIALSLIAGITTINIFIFGSGVDSPLESIWTFLFYFIVPVIWAAIGILMTIGATLGIYLPLIPFVIFTMGAVGWLFSTVEAMIAGPLVALGILSPSGHHEVLGESKPALMLLFNIFLRPTLMIFGLATAMLLCTVVASMVNAGFDTVKSNILSDVGAMGVNLIAFVLMLLAYTVIIVGALAKCFAAIYMVPEKVTKWIGSGGEQYGDDGMANEIKSGATQNAATLGKVGGDIVGAAGKIKGAKGGGVKGGKKG